MKLLSLTILNLASILLVMNVWKFIVPVSFKMRLLSAWRILTTKHYHLMTKNKEELIQHVSSAYGVYDEKWCNESGQRIDEVIDQWDTDQAVDEVMNIINNVK